MSHKFYYILFYVNRQQNIIHLHCIFLRIRKCIHRYLVYVWILERKRRFSWEILFVLFDIWFQINKLRSIVNKSRDSHSCKIGQLRVSSSMHVKIIERIDYWFPCIANWSFYKDAISWWNNILKMEKEFLTKLLTL